MPSSSVKYQHLSTEPGKVDPSGADKKWSVLWRVINAVMVAFFTLSAYVQLNDPDPYIWIPVYAIPALLSLAIAVHPAVTGNTVWKTVCVIHIALCIIGGLYLSAIIIEVLAGKISNPLEHEEGRELGGTIIVILWLAVCRFTSLGSSDPAHGANNALLLMTAILGCFPLVFWSLCFVDGLHNKLAHCKDMFPGMLGG